MSDAIKPKLYSYEGTEYTLAELTKMTGISEDTIRHRVQRGKSTEQAIALGISKRDGGVYEYRGRMMSVHEISRATGISPKMIWERVHSGWSLEEAAETPVGTVLRRNRLRDDARPDNPTAGMSAPEADRYNAAYKICNIIAANPYAFNFRCTKPGVEYKFEGDELAYTIQFTPNRKRARLTATYIKCDVESGLNRLYDVDGARIKEVMPE